MNQATLQTAFVKEYFSQYAPKDLVDRINWDMNTPKKREIICKNYFFFKTYSFNANYVFDNNIFRDERFVSKYTVTEISNGEVIEKIISETDNRNSLEMISTALNKIFKAEKIKFNVVSFTRQKLNGKVFYELVLNIQP